MTAIVLEIRVVSIKQTKKEYLKQNIIMCLWSTNIRINILESYYLLCNAHKLSTDHMLFPLPNFRNLGCPGVRNY